MRLKSGSIFRLAVGLCRTQQSTAVHRPTKYLLNKPQCNIESQKKIELVIAKLVTVGPRGRPFPDINEQMKTFCRDTNRMVGQVEVFRKDCYERTVRDYANILLHKVKRNIRKFCDKKGSKVVCEFLKLGPCANKYIQPRKHCAQEYIAKTKQLIDLADDTHKLHWACCYFVDGIKCAYNFLETVPCIREHKNTLMDTHDGVGGLDAINGQLPGYIKKR